ERGSSGIDSGVRSAYLHNEFRRVHLNRVLQHLKKLGDRSEYPVPVGNERSASRVANELGGGGAQTPSEYGDRYLFRVAVELEAVQHRVRIIASYGVLC